MSDAGNSAEGGVKETLISLIISLVMALIVKTYIIEAYRIPTGSMAPTLLGDHARFRGEHTGRVWPVDRGNTMRPPDHRSLADPVTGLTHPTGNRLSLIQHGAAAPSINERPRPGDRILVQKYLYEVSPPERFDIVVFRNPQDARQNYIKRLIGLPNEHVWLADGDVFASPFMNDPKPTDAALAKGTWAVQRKSVSTQRSLWRTLFSSEWMPIEADGSVSTWFIAPWMGSGSGWTIDGQRSYRYEGAAATELTWDTLSWPVTDWEPYNDRESGAVTLFPVADVRMRCAIEPDSDGLAASATIAARLHEFQASIENGRAVIRMRRMHDDGTADPWRVLADERAPRLRAGRATAVEFWHSDQMLRLFIDESIVATGVYDWNPAERLAFATGRDLEALRGTTHAHLLAEAATYVHSGAQVRWGFSGGSFRLHRVGLDRDIFYQPSLGPPREAAFGCHPDRVVTLGPDHFFMAGDNSADSLDGRGWPDSVSTALPYRHGRHVDPFVAQQIDPTPGVVHRKMVLGKAFFVYFPAPIPVEIFGIRLPIPMPDFGRMRLID